MKKAIFTALALSMMVGGYLSFSTVDSNAPVANAAKQYSGTMYVAGMGGHFAVAEITIDPSNTSDPIAVEELGMLDIGGQTHPTHDARIDVNDPNIMYWSTYKTDDRKPDGQLHVGKSNLKTGEVLKDVAFKLPTRVTWSGANYCASGQSKDSFMPISMANDGYIDVFDKATMKLKHRVFLDELGIKSGESTFAHGINTPDMSKFLLTVNHTPEGHLKWTGNTRLIMLDMKALEDGHLKKLAESMITGKPKDASGGTITFRQFFTQDGKYILQSGADRGYLIDANTLKVLDEITPLPGENHDIIPTPDGKYAVMTLREKGTDYCGEDGVDGTLLLYDITARKTIGKSVSVCLKCHKTEGSTNKAILCGLDGTWK
ncbi:MAG: hypothetical protein KKA70_00895 [Proteobacteria bacterium]|nr:hypothetical protein [Pseudomonadota bacterium]